MTLIVIHLLGGDVRERRGGLLRVEVGVRVNRRLSVHHKKSIPDHRLNARKFSKYFQKFFRAFDRLVNRPPVRNFFAVKTGDKQTIFDFLYRDFNFNFHSSSIAAKREAHKRIRKLFSERFLRKMLTTRSRRAIAAAVVSR